MLNAHFSLLTQLYWHSMRQGLCNDLSVRPSVCSICRRWRSETVPDAAAGLLLWARRAGDIDQQRRALGARQHGAACSRCEQWHVVSRRRMLNTNLLVLTLVLLALLVAHGVTTWRRHVSFPTTLSTLGSLSCMCYRVFLFGYRCVFFCVHIVILFQSYFSYTNHLCKQLRFVGF